MTARRTRESAPDTRQDALDVYLGDRKVGLLARERDSGTVTFTYDEKVLNDPAAAVSVRLPVRPNAYPELEALACFENLLPDGDLRAVLASATHRDRSDVIGLLGAFGGECAGAISLWPSGVSPPATPRYRRCIAEDVRAAFEPVLPRKPGGIAATQSSSSAANLLAPAKPGAFTPRKAGDRERGLSRPDDASGEVGADLVAMLRTARLSMSGAQEKLVLYRRPPIDDDPPRRAPVYRIPVAGAPGTVLVKRERGRFPGLVQNEIACMEMMSAAGVPTASHTVCALDARVYETARFDRSLHSDGTVSRLHAEDGCQLTGRRPHAKYTDTGGPTYAELRTVIRRYSADPITDSQLLFRWAVANLAIGNRDAHAKNITLLYHAPAVRRLSPAYDVVCTVAYRHLDVALPLSFGGQRSMAALTPSALAKASREFGFTVALARELVVDVCERIEHGRRTALHLAQERAGTHPVLDTLDVAVKALTSSTRRLLVGG